MTDLTRTSPATIRAQAPIDGANHFMISRGVRLLLVVDEEKMLDIHTADLSYLDGDYGPDSKTK